MNYQHLTRYFLFIISFFFISAGFNSAFAQDGEALYKANCTSCHAIKDKVIGPALAGVNKRHKEEWLIKWIRNSQAMVKAGDPVAVQLFNEYNKTVMTSFNLKDDEIKAILAYIQKAETAVEGPKAAAGATPVEEKSTPIWPWLIGAAVVLYLISGVLRRIQETLSKAVREKQGLPEPVPTTDWKKKENGYARTKN